MKVLKTGKNVLATIVSNGHRFNKETGEVIKKDGEEQYVIVFEYEGVPYQRYCGNLMNYMSVLNDIGRQLDLENIDETKENSLKDTKVWIRLVDPAREDIQTPNVNICTASQIKSEKE